jgi:hypothetical protein
MKFLKLSGQALALAFLLGGGYFILDPSVQWKLWRWYDAEQGCVHLANAVMKERINSLIVSLKSGGTLDPSDVLNHKGGALPASSAILACRGVVKWDADLTALTRFADSLSRASGETPEAEVYGFAVWEQGGDLFFGGGNVSRVRATSSIGEQGRVPDRGR